jgi:predicted component of type VI protein secretion system
MKWPRQKKFSKGYAPRSVATEVDRVTKYMEFRAKLDCLPSPEVGMSGNKGRELELYCTISTRSFAGESGQRK